MRRTTVLLALAVIAMGCGQSFRDACLLEVSSGLKEAAQVGTALHLKATEEKAALDIIRGVVRYCDELDRLRQE